MRSIFHKLLSFVKICPASITLIGSLNSITKDVFSASSVYSQTIIQSYEENSNTKRINKTKK